MVRSFFAVILPATAFLSFAVQAAAADMPGASDHPLLPRISGSEIYGYGRSDYDVSSFVKAVENNAPVLEEVEGDRTRILYIAAEGASPLLAQKNYETALADVGEVEEVFTCREKGCNSRFAAVVWNRESHIETDGLPQPAYLMGFSHNYVSPSYRYAKVVKDYSLFHVAVWAAQLAENNANADYRGRTAVVLEILEVKDFEPTLEFVDASEMQQAIAETGHVALYGIHFDHDKATLRAESDPTIAEIAKALTEDGSLSIYVVGHTDGVGALAYNQDLSLRRAQTVVGALAEKGIDRSRMVAIGIGPAAPIATNATEEGRALNRRVELVKR